ncbi:MAG TPA: 1-deoxy-D-xylulose-5-phosphate synthase N-terminal domain-containing protein, partial [Thermoanaerobaculia bacterium]|nr:1-deoxy-D-xylulose-5-phosphate synthase N-terminal domain-containing protein [Thermoanaerobaculia bacterium]
YFPLERLDSFYQDGSPLAGHATHKEMPGVEVSTGSLGHGLALATGMALASKRDGAAPRFWAMVSDGECDEGSTWEAALFAPQHRLDNLVVIVDYNKIQSLGRVAEVIDLEPLADKWRAFGWGVREIDGHDLGAIAEAYAAVPFQPGRPSCIVAHTVKGKGVAYMEDKLLYHYRAPRGEDLDRALAELEAARPRREVEIATASSAGLAMTKEAQGEEGRDQGRHREERSDEAISTRRRRKGAP